MSVQNEQASKEIDDKVKEVQIKSMQEKNTVEQLKNIIAERDRRINQLEEDLEDLRENMAVKRMTSTDPFYLATKTESKTENTEFVSTTIVKPASAANRSDSVDRETLNSRYLIYFLNVYERLLKFDKKELNAKRQNNKQAW